MALENTVHLREHSAVIAGQDWGRANSKSVPGSLAAAVSMG